MKNNNYKVFLPLLSVFMFCSCNDVLDETPDNRTQIDTLDKVSELLVAAYPAAIYASFLEPMSDNARDRTATGSINNRINEEMWNWRDINDINSDTPTNYWNEVYAAIAQANQALESLDELGLIDVEERGEALICRAYGHYMLVNIFAKAYNETTSVTDLGITYITKPETTLLPSYSRNTVKEVYDLIQIDLVEGLKYIGNGDAFNKFHFTTKSAHAFASRFYLTKGNWDKVIEHSTAALGTNQDVTTILRDMVLIEETLSLPEQELRYSSSTLEPANLLLAVGSSVYARTYRSSRFGLSNLLRTEVFGTSPLGTGWAYPTFSNSVVNFMPKYDEYFRVTNQAAGIGFPFVQLPLLTTDEVVLNRAEAYAMLGNLQLCLNDLNAVLSNKTDNYTPANNLTITSVPVNFEVADATLYTPFYAIPAASLPFVNVSLIVRKSVFFAEGLRWFDIKRHNMAVVHDELSDNGQEVISSFTLSKEDNRKAIQVPSAAQALGIEPNMR